MHQLERPFDRRREASGIAPERVWLLYDSTCRLLDTSLSPPEVRTRQECPTTTPLKPGS
jgi:hypothetical protein